MVDKETLDRELSRGEMPVLPPNIPPGFMGEVSPNMARADEFKPTLSAGLIQESTWETRWLTIGVLWGLVFTSPIAFWLLWRDPKISRRAKIIGSVIMVAGLVAVFVVYRR